MADNSDFDFSLPTFKQNNFTAEVLPPFKVSEDKIQVVGISYAGSDEIRITVHTQPVDRPKDFNPTDVASIVIKVDQLKWLAPRLEGLREIFKIENGYESKPVNK